MSEDFIFIFTTRKSNIKLIIKFKRRVARYVNSRKICDCTKRKENEMGAIAVSIFVSVVAIVGYIYFNHQDKKEAHKTKNKKNNARLSQNLR